jgi:hypothetical protein
MTDHDIVMAAYDSMALRWRNEDAVRYGAPVNERDLLRRHPEHLNAVPNPWEEKVAH